VEPWFRTLQKDAGSHPADTRTCEDYTRYTFHGHKSHFSQTKRHRLSGSFHGKVWRTKAQFVTGVLYNLLMNSSTAAYLIEINREFYTRFGDSFSATRHRIQPGVRRVLGMLKGDESILDLGCGNGELARELANRHQRGSYLGVDFSLPLLRDAESQPDEFSARFMEVDLTKLSAVSGQLSVEGGWSLITAFAVLHHIPSHDLRLEILRVANQLLKEDGLFIHSHWQFLNSEKLKARIQPWEAANLSISQVDVGDYLLDWRSGGKGLRYVHHFDERELGELASASHFEIVETFYSDGETGNLGLYQIWQPI
jgi:tRNA (uracil-5-)-methyltransferase TRM9